MSDCGSNLKEATRELNLEHPELNQDKINFTDQQCIKLKFNPPSSPHIGAGA